MEGELEGRREKEMMNTLVYKALPVTRSLQLT